MQHAAHVWHSYVTHVPPPAFQPPARSDDLLAFPKSSLRFLGLPEDAVPPSGEVLDEQVSRLVHAVPEGPEATARVEEIRRNATIIRAYVFATLDKRSGGWSTTSLDEDETNYTTLEAKKEEIERALATMPEGAMPPDADRIAKRKLMEVTRKRDETKARYIASLSKEIMKVARAALGRISPDTVASSEGVAPSLAAASSPSSSSIDATAPTMLPPRATTLRHNSSFASLASFDSTHPTDGRGSTDLGETAYGGDTALCGVDELCGQDGFDDLERLDGLDIGDLLSEAELRHMDLEPPTGPSLLPNDPLGKPLAAELPRPVALPPLPPIDLSLLSPQKVQKVAQPPSRPTLSSWCSWPTE